MTSAVHHQPRSTGWQPSRGGLGASLVGVAIGLTLWIGTAAGLLVLGTSGRADASVIALIWLNITLVIAALSVEISRRPYSLHASHLLSLFLFLGAPALLQYASGTFAVAGPIDLYRKQIPTAVFAVLLWILGYVGAYEFRNRLGGGRPASAVERFLDRRVTMRRAVWVNGSAIVVLIYLGFVIGLAGVTSRAGAYEAQTDFAIAQGGVLGGGLVLYLINQLLLRAFPFVALVSGILVLREHGLRSRPLLIGLLLILVAGIYVADNPFAGQRIWLVTCILAVAAPLLLARMKTAWALVAGSVFGLTILPALSANRHAESFSDWLDWFRWIGLASPVDYLAKSTDTDSLGMLVMCVEWTTKEGYQWGLQILTGLLAWFPRSLWPGKGIGTGKMVTEDLGFEFTNLAPPIMAEPLVDFGLVGVLPFACFVGWGFAKLDQIYWARRQQRSTAVRVVDVVMPFWLGLTVLLTRGDLLAATVFILAFTFWILVLGVGARRNALEDGSNRDDAADGRQLASPYGSGSEVVNP